MLVVTFVITPITIATKQVTVAAPASQVVIVTVPAFDLEKARADFLPPPPPPPPAESSGVVGSSSSGAAVGVVILYFARGMLGVWIIGNTEQRQSTFCEFAIWPAHNNCPALTSQQRKYLELAWQYANLKSVQEKLLFARMDGTQFPWPSSIAEMRAAIRRECLLFPYNNCRRV